MIVLCYYLPIIGVSKKKIQEVIHTTIQIAEEKILILANCDSICSRAIS